MEIEIPADVGHDPLANIGHEIPLAIHGHAFQKVEDDDNHRQDHELEDILVQKDVIEDRLDQVSRKGRRERHDHHTDHRDDQTPHIGPHIPIKTLDLRMFTQ